MKIKRFFMCFRYVHVAYDRSVKNITTNTGVHNYDKNQLPV
jgi:hypothetical protein